VAPSDGSEYPSAFAQFTGYLVLDALIGHTDRHEENWGVIEGITGAKRLAPSFDHASSLGFLALRI
jgi:serine/threonine protein kinase HipA of HipAB toxin-antitoxin module